MKQITTSMTGLQTKSNSLTFHDYCHDFSGFFEASGQPVMYMTSKLPLA